MKNFLVGVFALAVVAVLVFTFGFSRPDADSDRAALTGNIVDAGAGFSGEKVAIDKDKSSFEFEGFGPGKSHVGTFDEWEGSLFVEDGEIVGLEGILQVDSVNTGIEGLDGHLKGDDFFDAEIYPEIIFVSTSLEGGTMTGLLEFHGVKEEISFPVEVSEDGISADFVLDITPFDFKYRKITRDVRLAFDFVV